MERPPPLYRHVALRCAELQAEVAVLRRKLQEMEIAQVHGAVGKGSFDTLCHAEVVAHETTAGVDVGREGSFKVPSELLPLLKSACKQIQDALRMGNKLRTALKNVPL
jgi:hypothetical protein